MAAKKESTTQPQQQEATAIELRKQLKELVKRELAALPELLEQLDPRERVQAVIKLLPYVSSKVVTVQPDYGENGVWY